MTTTMRLLPVSLVIAGLVTLGSCAAPRIVPRPVVAPPMAMPVPPPPAPKPALGADWRDWPLTPGDWVYRRDARGSLALFGPIGADATVTLRCDAAARQLYLSVPGAVAATLNIRTTSTVRALAAVPTGGAPSYVAVALNARDPLLDAIAFSRGRFVIERAGTAPLVVPVYAEIGRVIEDCRG